jgi:epoxyqueuosine reductase
MDPSHLTHELKHEARRLGFDLVGVCPAVQPGRLAGFHQWLQAGYAGEMRYLQERAEAYEHPRHVLDGVRSLVMLAMNYRTVQPRAGAAGRGRVSRYAWGSDYHDVGHQRLRRLADFVQSRVADAQLRGVVDTAPLLEREFAVLAGLGWIGKNSLLLNKQQGSWFLLAALLTDCLLEYDAPHETDHCGTCRACLDACPTGAFVEPYVLDSRRCISYLTIELRGPVPRELRPGIGPWLFGCDVCQEVCPWNHDVPRCDEPGFEPAGEGGMIELGALFELDDDGFRRRFRTTPLWRPKRRGLLRNAALVLGNQRDPAALPALRRGLDDREPLVRGACAWALGQLERDEARRALEQRLQVETDGEVREEIAAALSLP